MSYTEQKTSRVYVTRHVSTDEQRFWEDDSSDEDRPAPAFPVGNDNTFTESDGQLPATATEYLQIVRRQAAAMPNVFVSPKTPYVQVVNNPALSITKLAHTPPFLRPSTTWAREQIVRFAELQERTFNVQSTNTSESTKSEWVDLICSDKVHKDIVNAADFKSIVVAISAFDELLPCIQRDYEGANGMAVRDAILAGCRAQWLYALLTRLRLPLDGATAGTLRSILRKLTFARLATRNAKDPSLAPINLLIVLLGTHFRQA